MSASTEARTTPDTPDTPDGTPEETRLRPSTGLIFAPPYRAEDDGDAAAAAVRLGMMWSRHDALGILPNLALEEFRGPDKEVERVENVMWGTWEGRRVVVFDYSWREKTEDRDEDESNVLTLMTDLMALLPHRRTIALCEIEVGGGRITISRGSRDDDSIPFESERFNNAFDVKASDPRLGTAVVDPRMMEWLLTTDDVSFEVLDGVAACVGGFTKPAERTALLQRLLEFRDHIPRVAADLYPRRNPSPLFPEPAPVLAAQRDAILDRALAELAANKWLTTRRGEGWAIVGRRHRWLLHLLWSIFTFGIWLPGWLAIAIRDWRRRRTVTVDRYGVAFWEKGAGRTPAAPTDVLRAGAPTIPAGAAGPPPPPPPPPPVQGPASAGGTFTA